MAGNLKFLQTLTVGQFKAMNHMADTDKICVKRMEASGKCFFTAGLISGKVSTNGYAKAAVFSKVQGEPDEYNPDGVFWLLHNEGEGGKVTIVDQF